MLRSFTQCRVIWFHHDHPREPAKQVQVQCFTCLTLKGNFICQKEIQIIEEEEEEDSHLLPRFATC